MKNHLPRALRCACLASTLTLAASLHAAILDDFNYTSFTNDQTYWTRSSSGGDTAFLPAAGTASLRSRMTQTEYNSTNPVGTTATYSVLVSGASDQRFNFFTTSYTVSVDEITLTAVNLNLSQSFLRIGLSSTNVRQFSADDAMTMRIRYNDDGLGGLLLFGYKTNQANLDAENRNGAAAGSLNSVNFTGTIQSASFSLNPVGNVGDEYTIGYTVSLTTTAQTYSATGTMLIDQTTWGDGSGFSALAIESRRNGNLGYSGTGDSDARVNLGSVSYTAVPEPSAFAALAGLGMLGFAASRRRRA